MWQIAVPVCSPDRNGSVRHPLLPVSLEKIRFAFSGLSQQAVAYRFRCVGQYLSEVCQYPLSGLFRCTVRTTGRRAEQRFRRGEQRPAPAVRSAVSVLRIDKIFGHDVASHFEVRQESVELAAHPAACEAAFGSQLACDEAAAFP